MAKITFDGIEVEVPDGTTILNAARKIGGGVVPPAMCYYTPLKGSGGKCRACLVRVAAGSAKDPRPMPKLVASCITPVQDGMVVENTTSQQVLDVRKGVIVGHGLLDVLDGDLPVLNRKQVSQRLARPQFFTHRPFFT